MMNGRSRDHARLIARPAGHHARLIRVMMIEQVAKIDIPAPGMASAGADGIGFDDLAIQYDGKRTLLGSADIARTQNARHFLALQFQL